MTAQFPLSGPMSVGELLGRAFRLYQTRFGVLLLTAAIFLLPLGIVPAVGTMFEKGSSFPLLVPGAIFYAFSSATPGFTHLAAVLMFPVAYILAALVFTIQSSRMLHGRPLAAREVLREGLGRLLPYAATTITKWVVVIVAVVTAIFFAIFGVIFLALVFEAVQPLFGNPESYSSLTFAVQIVGGFLGFAIPTVVFGALPVYLLARMVVAPAALLVERTGTFESFRRSWELTRGHSRRMMGYVLLLFFSLRLFHYAPAIVFQMTVPRLLPELHLSVQTGIAIAIHSVMSTISAPAAICTTVLLYYDLRIRKDVNDLELGAAEPGEEMAQDDDEEIA